MTEKVKPKYPKPYVFARHNEKVKPKCSNCAHFSVSGSAEPCYSCVRLSGPNDEIVAVDNWGADE